MTENTPTMLFQGYYPEKLVDLVDLLKVELIISVQSFSVINIHLRELIN